MESFKRALENIGRMWANLNVTQRIVIVGAAGLMVLVLVVGSLGTSQPWVRVAGAEVDAGKRSAIIKKLQDQNLKHEVRGNDIYVPKEDADRIVLELAGDGTVSSNAVWKFLEQSDIFATRWDKEKRFQIALQTRLEGMIRSVDSVKNAAVVINPGSTSNQLGFAGPKPSASVQVDLKDGMSLSRKNVQAIAGLVASAVPGIEISQVHIMDTAGNPYRVPNADNRAGIMADFYDYQKRIEDDIQAKIKSAFAFSAANVVVGIKVKNVSSEKEELKHGASRPVETEEKRIKKGAGGKTPARIKGEPGSESVETPSREEETQSEVREKSVVDQTKITEQNPAGDIEKITIGVLIPVEEGPAFADAERLLPKLRDFVLKASPMARAEDVSVQLIPTKRPQAVAVAQEPALTWFGAHWSKLLLGLLTVVAILMVIRVINRSTAQDTVEELQALTSALTETREAAAELGAPVESELARLRQGIQEMAGRNPQAVAASLKSFMTGR